MTDTELVTRAVSGDPAAFGELVDRHKVAVYRVARAALHSHIEADDVTQEAFIAAYRHLDDFRHQASFRTWLLAIAWNTARMHRRRAWRWLGRYWGLNGEGPPREPGVPGHESDLVAKDLHARITRVIAALPAKYRDVLLLAAADDVTTADMSAMLGIPEGTVKWRLSEARRRLKEKLIRLGIAS